MSQTEFYKLFYNSEVLYRVEEETSWDEQSPALISPESQDVEEKEQQEEVAYPYKIVVLVDNPQQEELDASEGVLL